MKSIGRALIGSGLLAIAAFAFFTFLEVRDLAGELAERRVLFERTLTEARMLPGIPAELRDAWRTGAGATSPEAPAELRWLSLGLSNEGYQTAGYAELTARLTVPVAALTAVQRKESGGLQPRYRPMPVSDIEPTADIVDITLAPLPPGQTHWVFFGIDPAALPADLQRALRASSWSEVAPELWRSVTVVSARNSGAATTVSETKYGLGAVGEASRPHARRPGSDDGSDET